jgi:hypothetical protein
VIIVLHEYDQNPIWERERERKNKRVYGFIARDFLQKIIPLLYAHIAIARRISILVYLYPLRTY